MEESKNNKVSLSIVGIIVVVLAGLGIAFSNKKPATPDTVVSNPPVTTPVDTTTSTSTTVTTPITDKKTVYKSGTYSATGQYNSPGGSENVDVTVTLKNDVITDATVVSGANDPESRQFQSRFISGFKQYVVGKNIDALNVTRVSGSSLTSGGFNDAIAKIKAEAKA